MKIVVAVFALTGILTLQAQTVFTPGDLGHGINLGDYLEAAHEGDQHGHRLLSEDDFFIISKAGFKSIRVPICWSTHVSADPAHTINPAFFERIDWVVNQAEKNNLIVILDYHNDYKLMQNPDAEEARFLAIWQQVADHYKDAPPTVLFELLNEPHVVLQGTRLNQLIAKALPILRANNPTRWILVGGTWDDPNHLAQLDLPADDHYLIATIHFYDPLSFTHQGANWVKGADKWLGTHWLGTPADLDAINKKFDTAAAWGKANNRHLQLGEFGAYQKGDFNERVNWINAVSRAADARGIPYTYWEYDSHFGAYDPVAQQWHDPMLKALLPDSTSL